MIYIKNSILIFFIIIICFSITLIFAVPALSPKINYKYTIVLDAGHGGVDGGGAGVVTGNLEKNLNLDYVRAMQVLFESNGIKVILTRDGDYDFFGSGGLPNQKRMDMEKRLDIINKAKPDVFISVHMNMFSMQSVKGAQTFYSPLSDSSSKILAQNVLNAFTNQLPYAWKFIKEEEYFLLDNAPCPAILVECGYLTNPEEDRLLSTKEHRDKVCYSVFCGVYSFLLR